MNNAIYDGQGVMHPMFIKHNQIMALRDSAFCVVEEYNKKVECTKNRFGDRTMNACKNYDFEKIRMLDISGTVSDIRKKYYGKNVWLIWGKNNI